jgi:Mn2+/Fe2+ NRAMP family transporter
MSASPPAAAPKSRSLFGLIGPGLLLAATGVGGGDLATASFVGDMLGTAVLWAALVAAFLKFVVTEGLARWQLATGDTLLEGVAHRFGRGVIGVFLAYLLLWSFFVGSAQMSANGATLHAVFPVFADARTGKIVFGVVSSLVGVALVLWGGFRAFEIAMRICIGTMFAMVIVAAVFFWPGTGEVLEGLFIPRIPRTDATAITWTVALIGGLGGTLTVLSYGYWMREVGRSGRQDLAACRIDLGASYLITAVFGIAMMIVGRTIHVEGEGTGLLVSLSDQIGVVLGPVGKWIFLAGTFGTVFSSLLGVWQAAPYLFADSWRLLTTERGAPVTVDTKARPYRGFLLVLAFVPMVGLFLSFREVQKLYTVIGAYIFPTLALTLLIMNGRTAWVGRELRNRWWTAAALVGVLVFFSWLAIADIQTT